MDIAAVISQISTHVTAFGGRVGGAANYALGLEMTVNPEALPACYVFPIAEAAGPNQLKVGLVQLVEERIGVVVQLDATADRRGETAVLQVDDVKYLIFGAILNWSPYPVKTRTAQGFSYGGGQLINFDRSRLWYQYEFDLKTTISHEDGWVAPSVPLTNVRTTNTTLEVTGNIPLAQS
jgi:hypothetical protein